KTKPLSAVAKIKYDHQKLERTLRFCEAEQCTIIQNYQLTIYIGSTQHQHGLVVIRHVITTPISAGSSAKTFLLRLEFNLFPDSYRLLLLGKYPNLVRFYVL